jgi:hypothetical protein
MNMEPSSAAQPTPPTRATPASPPQPHPLNHDELLELGILAVEEPDAPQIKPVPVAPAPPEQAPAPAPEPLVPAEKVTEPAVAKADLPSAVPVDGPATDPEADELPLADDSQEAPEGVVVSTPEAPHPHPKPSKPVPAVTRMEMSANTHDLQKLGRLRTLNTSMNIVVIILLVIVAVAGWFFFSKLTGGSLLDKLR